MPWICASTNSLTAVQFELSPPPADAVSAVQFAPNSPHRLLVASWDRNVYLYDTQDQENGGALVQKYEHRAPVLDVCFGADDNEAFTAGMDWQVKRCVCSEMFITTVMLMGACRIDLESGEQSVLSTHEAPVKSVVYSKEHCKLPSCTSTCPMLTHECSIARVRFLGQHPSHSPSLFARSETAHSPPALKTALPLHNSHKARCSNELAPRLHLRTLDPPLDHIAKPR